MGESKTWETRSIYQELEKRQEKVKEMNSYG